MRRTLWLLVLLVLTGAVPARAAGVFEVRYEGVPDAARARFEDATRILSERLASAVPIRVRVVWIARGPTGFALPRSLPDPRDAGAGVRWPSALVNTLAGARDSELDDMNIFLSGATAWHYGEPEAIAAEQTDFLTVAIHELAHGLGMSSASFVPWEGDAPATIGLPNPFVTYFELSFPLGELVGEPFLYDLFVRTPDGRPVADSAQFPNGSAELDAVLRGPGLVFDGPATRALLGGAPAPLAAGNMAHFSAQAYPPGSADHLMTPSSGEGSSNPAPGPLLLAVLRDLGWPLRD